MSDQADYRAQCERLLVRERGEDTFFFECDGGVIPFRFRWGRPGTKTLLVLFHGVFNRAERELPPFPRFLRQLGKSAHQLAVSDPAISARDDCFVSWYAGYDGLLLQKILPDVLAAMSSFLRCRKHVFFGNSAGGFAALYYGWHMPRAVVLAGNPHTRIGDFYPGHVSNYLSTCWPKCANYEEASQFITDDVRKLYAERFGPTVIYVQSTGDSFHMMRHMAPFLQAVAESGANKLICNSGYWGKMRHQPCPEAYLLWLRSVLAAPSTRVADILTSYHALSGQGVAPLTAGVGPRADEAPAEADLRMAALLRDLQLSRDNEG